ncbi:MAG: hypothetical protein IT306_25590 [Chloroflexi bacterium]|nr:hypothetical protein [Chloroflexota bacterium]
MGGDLGVEQQARRIGTGETSAAARARLQRILSRWLMRALTFSRRQWLALALSVPCAAVGGWLAAADARTERRVPGVAQQPAASPDALAPLLA